MLRSCAIAIFGAFVTTLSSTAAAQVSLLERVRVQGGFLTEQRPAPQERLDDWHIGVLPEITLASVTPTSELSLTYGFSGVFHTTYPNQTAHSLSLNGRFELSRRTVLVTSAFVSKTTLTNLLLTQPASRSPTTLLPMGTSTDVVTSTVGQGLAHEASPYVRLEQHATATFFTSLPPAAPMDSFAGTVGGSAERVWERDAIGPEASVGYSIVRAAPPFPNQDFILFNGGPHWRHDWSRSLSSLVAGGVSGLVSPNGSAQSVIAPFGRGSLLYTLESGASATLNVSTGITPNPLTGQAIRAHQASLRIFVPISRDADIYAAGTIGYMRGGLIDLRRDNDQTFHSANSDLELTWRPTEVVEIYGRYTFLAQIMDDASAVNALPSFLRDSFLVGVALASHPADYASRRRARGRIGPREDGSQFPQRVDRADAPGGGRNEDRPDADEQRRERPPEGVNGTRWMDTTERPPEGIGGSRWDTTPARPPEGQDQPRR